MVGFFSQEPGYIPNYQDFSNSGFGDGDIEKHVKKRAQHCCKLTIYELGYYRSQPLWKGQPH